MLDTVKVIPFSDQKPGTSGLRKRVKVYQQEHYAECFLSSILSVVDETANNSTLVLGGDGRFLLDIVVQKAIKLVATHPKIVRLIVGRNGILSTPAASHLIRKHGAIGGILLTASHNPGGPDADFGIKFNVANGGPAVENITNRIFQYSKTLNSYTIARVPDVYLDQVAEYKINHLLVQVVDSAFEYVELLRTIFDFDSLKQYLVNKTIVFDGMHGVTGAYAKQIFVDELGLPSKCLINCTPLKDFGGHHPDPNLTHASALVKIVFDFNYLLGAASDGDGDRNMIVGAHSTFVNPSDSVAVIASWAECIPYFSKGLLGVARSMPTSRALDLVAKSKNIKCYEVPTGWKFFGNLMDANLISLCGEESFGTGSTHIREKDGIWAILAWLSILEAAAKKNIYSVKDVLVEHYKTYGRHVCCRLDYEGLTSDVANQFFVHLRKISSTGQKSIESTADFEYNDPIDKTHSTNQGLFVNFTDKSRIVFRLSGTGSEGATIRVYLERYISKDDVDFNSCLDCSPEATNDLIRDLRDYCLKWTQLQEIVGKTEPSVVT